MAPGPGQPKLRSRSYWEQFLILEPPARPVDLKMGLLGLLPVLALFILLGGVQEPELVEGFFGSKYWGLGPSSGDMEVAGREEQRVLRMRKTSPTQPEVLDGRKGDIHSLSLRVLPSSKMPPVSARTWVSSNRQPIIIMRGILSGGTWTWSL